MIEMVTLDNGVRVVMEKMSSVRSVSVGVWVNTGSVSERPAESGASHMIEHMVFKGTERRTAQQIAAEMDSIGGNLNAFTSKECTCFYAKVLDEHLPVAMDMLSDIVLHSTFDPSELKKEQGVVVEEILMNEDSPEDVAAEAANELFYADDPLAHPILGTQQTVRSFTRESLFSYMDEHYMAGNIVIACAGSFDKERLLALANASFDMPKRAGTPLSTSQYPGGKRTKFIKKDIEQVHINLTFPGCGREAKEQYPLAVLSNIIGGSMSSRMFQKIREERGLAYSVYSYPIFYSNSGTFSIYAGCGDKQATEVTRLMLEELASIRKDGVTQEEFSRCKEQLKGSYLLGLETSGSRMNVIGKVALLQNKIYNEQETIRRIESVTMEDVLSVIPKALDDSCLSGAFVGRVEKYQKQMETLLGV